MGCCHSADGAPDDGQRKGNRRRRRGSMAQQLRSPGREAYGDPSTSAAMENSDAHHVVEPEAEMPLDIDPDDAYGCTPPTSPRLRQRVVDWLASVDIDAIDSTDTPIGGCTPVDDDPVLPTLPGIPTSAQSGLALAEVPCERIFMDDAFVTVDSFSRQRTPSKQPQGPFYSPPEQSLPLQQNPSGSFSSSIKTPGRIGRSGAIPLDTSTPSTRLTPPTVVPVLSVDLCSLEPQTADSTPTTLPSAGNCWMQSPSHMLHPGFGLTRRSSRNTMTSVVTGDIPNGGGGGGGDILLDYFDALPVQQSRRRSAATTHSSFTQHHGDRADRLPGEVWIMGDESASRLGDTNNGGMGAASDRGDTSH